MVSWLSESILRDTEHLVSLIDRCVMQWISRDVNKVADGLEKFARTQACNVLMLLFLIKFKV